MVMWHAGDVSVTQTLLLGCLECQGSSAPEEGLVCGP